MKKNNSIIAIVAITIFTTIGCKKESSWTAPAIIKSKLETSGLAYIQLTQGKYMIYKDSASGDLDSVIVTNSSIKDIYSPPLTSCFLGCSSSTPYFYESFTLILTKYNGMLQSEWFNGSTTSPNYCFYCGVSDSFLVELREGNDAIVFKNHNNYLISFLVVEGKTYTQVFEYTWNTPNKKKTYYWAKSVGIIKRVVTISGVTKTQTLLRKN